MTVHGIAAMFSAGERAFVRLRMKLQERYRTDRPEASSLRATPLFSLVPSCNFGCSASE